MPTTNPIRDMLARARATLDEHGVWFEVTNLIVPTYTDKMEMIRRMCDWLLKNLGPDYPLHFSRFHPHHKLSHLPPTPTDVLLEAREIARTAGLHYVYVGNVRDVEDAGLWALGIPRPPGRQVRGPVLRFEGPAQWRSVGFSQQHHEAVDRRQEAGHGGEHGIGVARDR